MLDKQNNDWEHKECNLLQCRTVNIVFIRIETDRIEIVQFLNLLSSKIMPYDSKKSVIAKGQALETQFNMSKYNSDIDEMYIDLLKRCLTRYNFGEVYEPIRNRNLNYWRNPIRWLFILINKFLAPIKYEIVKYRPFDASLRTEGKDRPIAAETMIGLRRLDNLKHCIADILKNNVAGDLIETGVWRGGSTIFMRALLKVYQDNTRLVWVADSFQGLPKPDPSHYPADTGDTLWKDSRLAISLEEVKGNFTRYGMLDNQVRFLVGWFRDTLPTAPIERLALLRLDGDLYESTMDSLHYLYPKVSIGGYIIIDDYSLPCCKAAVDDYRNRNGIKEKLEVIDWTGVYWKRLQ